MTAGRRIEVVVCRLLGKQDLSYMYESDTIRGKTTFSYKPQIEPV